VRDCMTASPDTLAASVPPGAMPTDSLPIAPTTDSFADARRPTAALPRAALRRSRIRFSDGCPPLDLSNICSS
jgi:hypothetical protein